MSKLLAHSSTRSVRIVHCDYFHNIFIEMSFPIEIAITLCRHLMIYCIFQVRKTETGDTNINLSECGVFDSFFDF